MIDNANDFLNLMQKDNKVSSFFNMATVQNVTASGFTLKFNSDNATREKKYKKLASYQPQEGDYVLCAKISNTYVVLGKVE